MADILIKNMELPKGINQLNLYVSSDGTVIAETDTYEGDISDLPNTTAIAIPSHGRLCDKDELGKRIMTAWDIADKEKKAQLIQILADIVTPIFVTAPTIVEASNGSDN